MHEYPWQDVLECTNKKKSSVDGMSADEYIKGMDKVIVCPNCNKILDDLDVFYFEHQAGPLVGVGGWMIACLDCKKQLHFDMEWIS